MEKNERSIGIGQVSGIAKSGQALKANGMRACLWTTFRYVHRS
jgi:hypothetical protein